MNNLPFVIPDRELYLRMSILLLIIDTLSFSKKGVPVLKIERIILFDYLVRHPVVLYEVLKNNGFSPTFELNDKEVGSIGNEFLSRTPLFDYRKINKLLQFMILNKFLDVSIHKGDVFYVISKKGTDFTKEITSEYLQRVQVLCEALIPFKSFEISKIKQHINSIIGV